MEIREGLIEFINENKLSPFNRLKTPLKTSLSSIYKTRDAKTVHNKVISKISQDFIFSDTSNLFDFFNFTENELIIEQRQNFFNSLKHFGKLNNMFLKEIKKYREYWSPKYDVAVVTEDSNTFNKLKELNIPAQLLVSETDIAMLEQKDLIQTINCYEFGLALEDLPQTVVYKNIEEVYPERHLEKLSSWADNLIILKEKNLGEETNTLIRELLQFLPLIEEKSSDIITPELLEQKVNMANDVISNEIKNLSIQGNELMLMLSKGFLPDNLKNLVNKTIKQFEIPQSIIIPKIPLLIDEEEMDKLIKRQSAREFSNIAETIKQKASELKEIPIKIQQLSNQLIYFDFISGITQYMKEEMTFPIKSKNNFTINYSKNLFIPNPQAISFNLSEEIKCSILTGANSGGKTTLLEHIIQLNSLFQLGLPVEGKFFTPVFTDIYYFAKNKGSASKGAFETLLEQMSQINPGDQTLILADEIEAVTEPGVAGNIIAATADFFIKQNCYLVIATHLGHEIQKVLPENSRIDGIEAKGLTDKFELIIDHNPIQNKLAHSTPELIVEKLAKTNDKPYFQFLNDFLKNSSGEQSSL
jgi:DNA mismatch repair protein MutS2